MNSVQGATCTAVGNGFVEKFESLTKGIVKREIELEMSSK